MGFEIVDFREHAAQPADVNGWGFNFPARMSSASNARISCVRPSANDGISTHPLRLSARWMAAVSRSISPSREKSGGTSRLPRVVSMMSTSAFTSSKRAARKIVWS